MNLKHARDTIDMFYGFPMNIISDCIRGFITAAPGNKFIAGDFAQIEGRVLPWLAGQQDKLDLFATGKDIYLNSANGIYGVPEDRVTTEQRVVGKVAELALGFGGGKGAFQSMAKNYHVKVPDTMAEEIKNRWRSNNQEIVAYWYKLENAAEAAVRNPGEKFHAGQKGRHVTYLCRGSWLLCQLPSGRVITYPYPKFRVMTMPWGDRRECLTYKGERENKWIVIPVYGGLLSENVTQAVARDFLVEAMFRWEENGLPIVMHVHDEIVTEVPENDRSKDKVFAEEIMCILPTWAEGIPIAAEVWEGKRYRK